MIEHCSDSEEVLHVLQEIHALQTVTQRHLSVQLTISLGKVNYLLRQLITKGLIVLERFARNDGRPTRTTYILTEEGLREKARLTRYFLHKKEEEYEYFRAAYERLVGMPGEDFCVEDVVCRREKLLPYLYELFSTRKV